MANDVIRCPELAGVIDPNRDEQGNLIDWRKQERAGILGTILFLEQVARWDTSDAFRREAAHQAKFLRTLMRRRANTDRDDLDGALREALEKLMAPTPVPRDGRRIVIDAKPTTLRLPNDPQDIDP